MKKLFMFLAFYSLCSIAEPSKPETISSDNSECTAKSSGGEYPSYNVYRGKEVIFAPKSDGISNAVISPSGKYIALAGSEVSLIDIEAKKFVWGLVILNCKSGKVKGFKKGVPTWIKSWKKENQIGLSVGTFDLKDKLP